MILSSVVSGTLTPCQIRGMDRLQREGNVFLTGAAGTGKSYLLERYLQGKPTELFPVVASTGAAAVIVGGRTFHSFFGLGIMKGGADATVVRAMRSKKLIRRLQRACCVVIDEISMLSGETLRAAEIVARKARERNEPWGGLRIIAVGDFAQLPPVTTEGQPKDWAFLHTAWMESSFQPALLSTVMRTQDLEFLTILNFVRNGIVNDQVQSYLNAHLLSVGPSTGAGEDHENATRLYPHRRQAEERNRERLEKLPGHPSAFLTHYVGEEKLFDAARKAVPIPDTLVLKRGALVMMRKNDVSGRQRYVNGSLGHMRSIADDAVKIQLLNGEEITVGVEKFSYLNGDGEEVVAAWNFPVTLAWATTIHKAQGASLDRIVVDLAELWEPGQAYVALSRVRSGAGLAVERWSPASIRAEPLVTAFYDRLADQAKKYVPRPLFVLPKAETLRGKRAHPEKRQHSTPEERARMIARLIEQKTGLDDISDRCGMRKERVLWYIERLLASGRWLDLRYLAAKIANPMHIILAFNKHGFDRLKPVFDTLSGKVSYDVLRLMRCVRCAELIERASKSKQSDVLYF